MTAYAARGSPSRGWPTLPGLSTTTPPATRLNCMCEWPTQTMSTPARSTRFAQVSGGAVDEQVAPAVERQPPGQGELQQVAPLVGRQALPLERAAAPGQVAI